MASWKRLEPVLSRVADVGSARGPGNTVPGAARDALNAAQERRRRLWSRVRGGLSQFTQSRLTDLDRYVYIYIYI